MITIVYISIDQLNIVLLLTTSNKNTEKILNTDKRHNWWCETVQNIHIDTQME